MTIDPFSDPFSDAPTGRRGNLFNGLKNHVSPAHVEHFKKVVDTGMQSARDIGGDLFDSAIDFAAENPDKMEQLGGKAGRVAGAAMGSPLVGGKAGNKVGKKLGGFLSKKAQEKKNASAPQSPQPDPNDPFA